MKSIRDQIITFSWTLFKFTKNISLNKSILIGIIFQKELQQFINHLNIESISRISFNYSHI